MKGDRNSDLSTFTEQNVSKELATPAFYRDALPKAGLSMISYHDLTIHLTSYFRLMQRVVTDKRNDLLAAGVGIERIEAYVSSLQQRFAKVESREFAWGVFVGRKEENFTSIKAAVDALERRIQEQYDTEASMIFYKYIMGGGGDNMHYGIFKTGKEDLLTASHNTVEYMVSLAAEYSALRTSSGSKMRVLDLGSGKGGTARFLAKNFGCHVTCMNLGVNQNKYAEMKAQEEGISHLISVVKGSFNEPLPASWTNQFDLVWSQEALCHAANRTLAVSEVDRVLKPGGTFVFSDLMKGEEYQDVRNTFSGGAITAKLASPSDYTQAINQAGLKLSVYRDLTGNLAKYFSQTARTVKQHRVAMLNAGVPQYRLEAYLNDLTSRSDAIQERAFAWGAFVAKKPSMPGRDGGKGEAGLRDAGGDITPRERLRYPAWSMRRSIDSNAFISSLSPADNWVSVSSMLADADERQQGQEEEPDMHDIPGLLRTCVSSDGGEDLYLGICNSADDDIAAASSNTVELMAAVAARVSPLMALQAGSGLGRRIKVLVLGAGKGTAARALARKFGCHVTCLEASDTLNDFNARAAREGGLQDLISCVAGAWSDPFPAAWTSSFDLVWGQELMRDDEGIGEVFMEVQRVLKPGGAAILSNLMQVDVKIDSPLALPSAVHVRAAADGAGLRITKQLDLSEHLRRYLAVLSAELSGRHLSLESKGFEATGIDSFREEVEGAAADVAERRLEWGLVVATNPHYNKCLLVGAGPLGSFAAWRLAACGISDITAKVLPNTPSGVKDMLMTAGCRLITEWEEVEGFQFNIVMVATKTHWLARIAHDMGNYGLKWDHLALIYNGYVKIPELFRGDTTASVVVPQSFSFVEECPAEGIAFTSVANGNTGNPWTFPPCPTSRVIVAQLKQAAVNATISSKYEDDQFFKFCVNNSANLLAVLTNRNCNDLTGLPDTRAAMASILQETFDVLQGDAKFAGLIPLERDEYIERVIGAVAAYKHHKPSSLQHFEQRRLADVAGLNGFITSMSRVTQVPSPVNEFIGRSADAACRAHRRGVPREAWEAVVQLSAAMRLVSHLGLGNSVWSQGTVRVPHARDHMMVSPFGTALSEACASKFVQVPIGPRKAPEQEQTHVDERALALHGAFYEACGGVGCILQAHCRHSLTLVRTLATGSSVCSIDFAGSRAVLIPQSSQLARSEADSELCQATALEATGHGQLPLAILVLGTRCVLSLGEDVPTAFSQLLSFEKACEMHLAALSAGSKASETGSLPTELDCDWSLRMARAEWEAHRRQLLGMPGEYKRPAYYE